MYIIICVIIINMIDIHHKSEKKAHE